MIWFRKQVTSKGVWTIDDDDGIDSPDAVLDAAADRLYVAPLERFIALRTELSKLALADGHAMSAKRIAALRKPTAAASLVNRLVLDEPGSIDRLIYLYDRLRQAHEDLDAAVLRELSTERRTVVSELAATALELDDRGDPPAALRDDVVATLDAAVADPDVAARLGRLTRPEHWSGFGVAVTTGAPELTLVRGGKDGPASKRSTGKRSAAKPATGQAANGQAANGQAAAGAKASAETRGSPAVARRLARARDKARTAFEVAEANLSAAEQSEQAAADRVKSLTAELAELEHELQENKRALEKSRREVKAMRARRREARSALDRADRRAGG
ncbi:MAG: hypothetical protein ACR2LX_06400 [Jatrophihabitans sp.]